MSSQSQPRQRKQTEAMPSKIKANSTSSSKAVYSPLDQETNAQIKTQLQDMSNPTRFLITVCMGVVFGFALNRGRVFEPAVIMDQFLFTRWIMMKMFLSAAATSTLCISLMKELTAAAIYYRPSETNEMKMFLSAAATSTLCISLMKELTPRQYAMVRDKPMSNLLGCVVGGALLGAGMAIGGMCPGMVLAQIGAGVPNCFISLAAILSGALIYGLIEPYIRSWNAGKTIAYEYVDDIFPHRHIISIGLATLLFALVLLLELLFPWQSELTTPLQAGCTVVTCRVFLSAAATSTLCISLMKELTPRQYIIVRQKPMTNLLGCVVGGAVLGAGMSFGGMCPGMVLAQIGAGVPNCFISLAAILSGALIYGLIEPYIRSWTASKTIACAYVDDIFPHRHMISIGLATVLFAVVLLLELLFPWQSELTTPLQPGCTVVTCRAWPPYVAGILVGALQIPAVAFIATAIGSSSSYVCVAGQWLRYCPQETHQHFKLLATKMTSVWQVVYVMSAVFGSALAVQLTGTMNAFDVTHQSFDGIKGGTIAQCIVGGLLNIFGSRFAKGCTSGHGISGMGKLSIGSMITVAAMFAGGALAALLV
eukprot:CAMPEP_0202726294 /NCGR_PEP_ID=MMETSP1385-20130828/184539_1 /ASSEMBLY_ACC=CAM_ASM_000861 /TAXON_ID=933848 /ORGANISM="Elphidium margaritaceum" /LENGTH=593 /DNA_ID=CAMNT_0049392511 /DNA_START=29 /DNA_END=1809 /DNA_ORIENTATION=+